MNFKLSIAVLIVTLFSACSGDNSIDLKEGKWSITTTTVMPGMPFQMPPMTITQCMRKDSYLPKEQTTNDSECKITEQKINGSTVTWTVVCPNSKSYGSITYKHDTFSGEVKVETDTPNGAMKMTSKMQGKYIGACE